MLTFQEMPDPRKTVSKAINAEGFTCTQLEKQPSMTSQNPSL